MRLKEFLMKWCKPQDENAIYEFEKDLISLEDNTTN